MLRVEGLEFKSAGQHSIAQERWIAQWSEVRQWGGALGVETFLFLSVFVLKPQPSTLNHKLQACWCAPGIDCSKVQGSGFMVRGFGLGTFLILSMLALVLLNMSSIAVDHSLDSFLGYQVQG